VHLFTGKRPYPVSVSFHDTAPEVPGWRVGFTGRRLRDLFDPAWPAAALELARTSEPIQRCAADDWCYGVFADNELPFGATTLSVGTHVDAYLTLPAGAPGRVELQRFFEERYGGDVAALSAAWGVALASFDELQRVASLTACPLVEPLADDLCLKTEPAQRRADRMAFEARVAGRHAEVVHAALREAAPGVLNLGLRLFSIYTHPDFVRATAPFTDVVSLNDYDYGEDERATLVTISGGAEFGYLFGEDSFADLATLHELSGKPILVGEWFYRVRRPEAGTPLPPLFPEVATHEDQAVAYRGYTDRMLSLPFVVGYHWFQWMDQPLEGRQAGGENQFIGVVDIEDELRAPLAQAMREVNAGLFERRADLAAVD
jgi:agarase